MIQYTKLDRRRLLDFLGSDDVDTSLVLRPQTQRSLDLKDVARRLEADLFRDEIAVLWKNGSDSLVPEPAAIVTPDAGKADFLAWVSTYIGTHRPFTAFFRVVTVSELYRFDEPEQRTPVLPSKVMKDLAGVAVAEAAIQTAYRSNRPSTISLQSCHLTFSFAILRGLHAGLHPSEFFELSEAWAHVRSLSSKRQLALSADRMLSFWVPAASVLLAAEPTLGNSRSWTAAVGDLVRAARDSLQNPAADVDWGEFGAAKTAMLEFDEGVMLTRERQLRRLDEIAARLRSSDLPVPMVEAVLGYFLARLSNGSFDYLSLAGEVGEDYQCCGLWFALFAIWREGFDGLSSGNSIGRHVAMDADARADLFSGRVADMSLDEFLILRDRKTPASLGNITSSVLDIELLPNVVSRFPNPFKQIDDNGLRPTPILDTTRASRLLREALSLLEGISKPLAETPSVELDDLFQGGGSTSRAKPKRRKKA